MDGTIARSRVKPGHEPQVVARLRGDEGQIPGAKAIHLYRMDADPSPSCEAVVFESKASYEANAASPRQHTRYPMLLEHLTGPPEWHDGEIVLAAA